MPELLKLRYHPDPVLNMSCEPIEKIDDEVEGWIRQMFEIMYRHRGIGLAGPQVGLRKQIFVINTSGDQKDHEEVAYINPCIYATRGDKITEEEGCLSMPGVKIDIARPYIVSVESVLFRAYNRGKPADLSRHRLSWQGIVSRCIQHEIDHLNGILITDRAKKRGQTTN